MDYAAIESSVRFLLEELGKRLSGRPEEGGRLPADPAGEVLSDMHLTL